jgi:antirestriction protein
MNTINKNTDSQPRIYIACLAAYNSGYLHGDWVDVSDEDEINEAIKRILESSPVEDAEEWAVHDYDNFFGLDLGEYSGITQVVEAAKFLAEHGKLGAKLIDYFGNDLEEAKRVMDECYLGEYESLKDYARELTEETREVPKYLEYYIDYASMGEDMELIGDIFTIETGYGEVHIFLNH